MHNRDVLKIAGVVAGAASVIALGFVLKKFLSNKKVEKFEDDLVAAIIDKSPISGLSQRKAARPVVKKATKKSRKNSKLAVVKLGNAKKLLAIMKKGKEYSQVMLEVESKIPYRSVRRYIELLVAQGKIKAVGYGKGKKFIKN